MDELWQDMKKVVIKHWSIFIPTIADVILGIAVKALVLACCIKYLWYS